MEIGRTFKSLEEPPNYFGCHISMAMLAILLPVFTLLGFLFLNWLTALLLLVGTMCVSAAIFGIGSWLGKNDPFWVEGGQRHLLDERNFLDV
jgi:hypothetical protein